MTRECDLAWQLAVGPGGLSPFSKISKIRNVPFKLRKMCFESLKIYNSRLTSCECDQASSLTAGRGSGWFISEKTSAALPPAI